MADSRPELGWGEVTPNGDEVSGAPKREQPPTALLTSPGSKVEIVQTTPPPRLSLGPRHMGRPFPRTVQGVLGLPPLPSRHLGICPLLTFVASRTRGWPPRVPPAGAHAWMTLALSVDRPCGHVVLQGNEAQVATARIASHRVSPHPSRREGESGPLTSRKLPGEGATRQGTAQVAAGN